uniref:Uncharacterized protein n=1 Tax=Heterorhabditis bacteriophora TaxID=37862 RepID=A0A1I7XG40_HETBA
MELLSVNTSSFDAICLRTSVGFLSSVKTKKDRSLYGLSRGKGEEEKIDAKEKISSGHIV